MKFLVEATYTHQGMQGLIHEKATQRREAIQAACKSVGGNLEQFYISLGRHNVVAIADLPDQEAVGALVMAIGEHGAVFNTHTTMLLSAQEADQAIDRSKQVKYTPPKH